LLTMAANPNLKRQADVDYFIPTSVSYSVKRMAHRRAGYWAEYALVTGGD